MLPQQSIYSDKCLTSCYRLHPFPCFFFSQQQQQQLQPSVHRCSPVEEGQGTLYCIQDHGDLLIRQSQVCDDRSLSGKHLSTAQRPGLRVSQHCCASLRTSRHCDSSAPVWCRLAAEWESDQKWTLWPISSSSVNFLQVKFTMSHIEL